MGATALAVAGRGLAEAAERVADHLERDDVAGARRAVPALVGRDPSELGVPEIARAVVESVAENTVDAVVAPALWARGRRGTGRPRLPGGEHARRHGRPPFAPLRALRVGQRPPRRRGRLGAGPPDRRAGRGRPARAGGPGRAGRAPRRAGPPVAQRRRGRGRLRRRPRACASAGPTATATASRCGPPSATGRPPGADDIAPGRAARRATSPWPWSLTPGPAVALVRRRRPAARRAADADGHRAAAGRSGRCPRARRPRRRRRSRLAAALGRRPPEMLDLSASLNPVAPDLAAVAGPPPRRPLGRYPDAGPATDALAGGRWASTPTSCC